MAKEIPRISITLPDNASAAVDSNPISANVGVRQGTICLLKVVTPNFTNAITITVGIYDKNAALKYSIAGLTENSGAAGHSIPVSIPIAQKEYVKVTPSNDPGGTGGTVFIDMEYIPDHIGS